MTSTDATIERLDSWKEIAQYLNRSERTVQRWERESGLPVRRVKSAKDAGSVYAIRSELDAWLLEGNASGNGQTGRSRAGSPNRRSTLTPMLAGLAALLALSAVAATLWLRPEGPPAGPTPVALTRDGGVTTDPTVSADGKWLAYASDRDGGEDLDIWIQPLPLGSASPIQVTDNPGHEITPDLSPDGKEVAWQYFGTRSDGVYVTSLVDGKERFVAPGGRPKYSPDGRWIALRRSGEGLSLSVVRRDGSSLRPLHFEPTVDGGIAWLPDSGHLVSVAKPIEGGKVQLAVTPIDGSPTRRITLDSLHESLRGKGPVQLTQLRFAPGTGGLVAGVLGSGDIWHLKLSPDWSGIEGTARRLLRFPSVVEFPNLVDGHLVFGARSRNIDIMSLPIDAEEGKIRGPVQRLTDNPTWSAYASVSADGSKIAYTGETSERSMRPWFKDLVTGESFAVDERLMPAGVVRISPDGTGRALRSRAWRAGQGRGLPGPAVHC